MLKPISAAAAAATAAALVLVAPGPASAATSTFADKAGDIGPGVDLRSVKVVNGKQNVRVVTTHRDLVADYRSQAGGKVFLDTDPDDKGPEYALIGGYFDGTDYMFVKVDGWNTNKDGVVPVDCSYRSRLDYRAEQVRSRFSQDCFDDSDGDTGVRVEVKVSGAKKGGGMAVDWLRTPRTFSAAVAQG